MALKSSLLLNLAHFDVVDDDGGGRVRPNHFRRGLRRLFCHSLTDGQASVSLIAGDNRDALTREDAAECLARAKGRSAGPMTSG